MSTFAAIMERIDRLEMDILSDKSISPRGRCRSLYMYMQKGYTSVSTLA